MRYFSISLGCPKNRVDTEHLLGSLQEPLFCVESPEEADLVFINTCGFIAPAVEESVRTIVQTIDDLGHLAQRPLLAVGGCMVGRYGVAELAAELPEVDLWLPNAELPQWPSKIRAALHLSPATVPAFADRLLSTGPSYAWLKIGDGCRHRCSFCTIPSIRGAYSSAPADRLEAEARSLLQSGVKELVLVAQDVSAWGTDLGTDLRSLLERLLPLDGLARLRLMYLYPTGLTDDLLRFLAEAKGPFVPYFDVPLQHAHPDILKAMGRPFAQDPRLVVDRIRHYFPEAALRTSLIVGFPGETEEHFRSLADFVAQSRFHQLGVFDYQAEEGTPAARMDNQVEAKVKITRRDAIMSLQQGISEDILQPYEGQRLEVLVDAPHEEWPGLHTARTWFQAPEVDGVTYVSGPGVEPGALLEADIVDCREYDLVALT